MSVTIIPQKYRSLNHLHASISTPAYNSMKDSSPGRNLKGKTLVWISRLGTVTQLLYRACGAIGEPSLTSRGCRVVLYPIPALVSHSTLDGATPIPPCSLAEHTASSLRLVVCNRMTTHPVSFRPRDRESTIPSRCNGIRSGYILKQMICTSTGEHALKRNLDCMCRPKANIGRVLMPSPMNRPNEGVRAQGPRGRKGVAALHVVEPSSRMVMRLRRKLIRCR